jgi:hypothetical protein
MSILPRFRFERKTRFFHGACATVGWEITCDRAAFWCESCEIFHIATGRSRDDVRGSCPAMDQGEKFLILTCGPVPLSILWSMYKKSITSEARRELDRAFSVLDALIEAEEVVS